MNNFLVQLGFLTLTHPTFWIFFIWKSLKYLAIVGLTDSERSHQCQSNEQDSYCSLKDITLLLFW